MGQVLEEDEHPVLELLTQWGSEWGRRRSRGGRRRSRGAGGGAEGQEQEQMGQEEVQRGRKKSIPSRRIF